MAASSQLTTPSDVVSFDWKVTDQRVRDVVAKIVELARPLRVVVFGSRARGDHRPDSDLDIAVILDEQSLSVDAGDLYVELGSVGMPMDLLVTDLAYHSRFSRSVNSVHHDIQREGVVYYEREQHGSASRTPAA